MAATTHVQREAFEAWRSAREQELAAPHGWLSLTALYWLDAVPRTFDQIPGRWSFRDERVTVSPTGTGTLSFEGSELVAPIELEPIDGAPGVLFTAGRRRLEVIRRGAQAAVRVRDPEAATRTRFSGVPRFPWDPGWLVPATFEAFELPRRVTVGAVIEGLTHAAEGVGRVHFELLGRPQTLLAYPAKDGDGLLLHLRDRTTGDTTHGSSRALMVEPPARGGSLTLDLNRLVNLPCAFTDHATCPLAPPENHLDVAVEAGERTPW
jgi:uncharacterized protein (DUF1684 family)